MVVPRERRETELRVDAVVVAGGDLKYYASEIYVCAELAWMMWRSLTVFKHVL